jgi:hypothetical protein
MPQRLDLNGVESAATASCVRSDCYIRSNRHNRGVSFLVMELPEGSIMRAQDKSETPTFQGRDESGTLTFQGCKTGRSRASCPLYIAPMPCAVHVCQGEAPPNSAARSTASKSVHFIFNDTAHGQESSE